MRKGKGEKAKKNKRCEWTRGWKRGGQGGVPVPRGAETQHGSCSTGVTFSSRGTAVMVNYTQPQHLFFTPCYVLLCFYALRLVCVLDYCDSLPTCFWRLMIGQTPADHRTYLKAGWKFSKQVDVCQRVSRVVTDPGHRQSAVNHIRSTHTTSYLALS